jgi:predicted MFS family arabinose efflux permease
MLASDRLPRALARLGIHYGWAVVAVIFLTMLATSAAMGMTAILMLPLKNEFGWDLGVISGALAVRFLVYGMVAPFTAAILSRYGMRTVIATALALIILGLVISSQMTALWQLWLIWGVLLGLATGVTANVLAALIAARWFVKKRGLVIGLLTASNATGQLLFLPLAAWLSDLSGWRYAMMPAGIICLVCLFLVLLIVRDHPSDVQLAPYGETKAEAPQPQSLAQNPLIASISALADVAGNRTFLILAGTFFVCGLSTSGLVQNHFIPLCSDFGIAAMTSSSILAMMGGFNFVGTVLSGWLSDRYDNRYLLFWYYGLRGLSLVALPYTDFSIYGLTIFAIFYGLDWIATVPPTARMTNDAFGREKGPIVFGWIFFSHQLGSAIAAFGAGVTREAFLTYLPAFAAAGIACLIAAGAILTIRRQSKPAIA